VNTQLSKDKFTDSYGLNLDEQNVLLDKADTISYWKYASV